MRRPQLTLVIAVALAVLTTIVVVTTATDAIPALGVRFMEVIVFGLLTAFAIALSIPLSRGELSLAHTIGMIAFLSLPADVAPAMTVAVFSGGIVGAAARYAGDQQTTLPVWQQIVFSTAQVTLAFYSAGAVYISILGGQLPFSGSVQDSLVNKFLPLSGYVLVYILVFIAIFAMHLYARGYHLGHVLRENAIGIVIILLLPIPFALIAAEVGRTDVSMLYFGTIVVGAALLISGLYWLTRSEQHVRRRLNEMEAVYATTQTMRGSLNLNSLLENTCQQIENIIGVRNMGVVLLDEADNSLTNAITLFEGKRQQHTRLDDEALIKYVMETHEALLLQDKVGERASALGVQPPNVYVQSWLGVPIISGERTVGAFVLRPTPPQRTLDDDDLRLMRVIVGNVGIAVENARLYNQQRDRAEQLATLNQVMALLNGTLSPSDVLDTIISSASTISNANAVTVYLSKIDDDSIQLARSAGMSEHFGLRPPQPLLASYELPEQFRINPEPMDIADVGFDERALSVRPALMRENKRAYIEVPLFVGRQLTGIIGLYFDKPQVFPVEQLDLLQAFGTQAAQAIHNARVFASTDEALEQRIEQLYVLAAMGRLLNATMDTNRIYEIVLNYTSEATRSPRGILVLQDEDKRLRVAAQRGFPADLFTDPEIFRKGLVGRVLESARAFRSGNVRRETGYLPFVPQTHSTMMMPILKGETILGLIVLESDEPEAYSESDSNFVAQIANQAVIAVDNTQLFQRITEARDNLAVILNAMEEGIIVIDLNEQITLANPRVDLVGLDPDILLNQQLESLLQRDDLRMAERLGYENPDDLRAIIYDYNRGKPRPAHAQMHSFEVSGAPGNRYIQRQIIPMEDEKGRLMGVMLVLYNKSEERELNRTREALSQMIVHDLRSPLTAVTTSLRLIEELVPADTKNRPVIDRTTDASRRAIRKVLHRIDALLDISRMENGQTLLDRKAVPLPDLIRSVVDELKPLSDEIDVEIVTQIPQDLPPLDIDGDKVERMMLNLVDNALKYSPAGSSITLRARLDSDGQYVRIDVVDEGPGIPDQFKEKLFDRYVQVEGREIVRRGVGLGLAFCRLVTEAHGGRIWVEDNASDNGSVFSATLPVLWIGA